MSENRSCPNCGREVRRTATFCNHCGTRLEGSSSPSDTRISEGAVGTDPKPAEPRDPAPTARPASGPVASPPGAGATSTPSTDPEPVVSPARHEGPGTSPEGRKTSWLMPALGIVGAIAGFAIVFLLINADGEEGAQTPPPQTTAPAGGSVTENLSGRIVFSGFRSGSWEVLSTNADGTDEQNLTNEPEGEDGHPTWSPDGSKIVYRTNADGNEEIYVMDADGGNKTRLTNHPAGDRSPSFSPDGETILFERGDGDQGDDNQIMLMNADGTNVRSFLSGGNLRYPAWSPDGTQIVYQGDTDGQENPDIYVAPVDAASVDEIVRLTDDPGRDEFPEWSPSGDLIAFASNRTGDFETFTMTPDGENETNITNDPSTDYYVAFSPDGEVIAFQTNRDADNDEIWVMGIDGADPRPLITAPEDDHEPQWKA